MSLNKLKQDLEKLKNPAKAKVLARFFKTGKGEYGEGDVFLGVVMPKQRGVVKKYLDLSLEEVQKLLLSKVHEHRMTGVLILVGKYERGGRRRRIGRVRQEGLPASEASEGADKRREIFDLYLRNSKNINNWDLVDLSAPHIVGDYLLEPFDATQDRRPRQILYKLARSKNLWERRIAILATFAFIRVGEFGDTLKISEILLNDEHDLIHKAVGWMLREVGKRDLGILEKFLNKYHKKMPRTMLRYAIERMDEGKRKFYMIK